MTTFERIEGWTPNGGSYSTIGYFRSLDDHTPADKGVAGACEITEYDAKGGWISSAWVNLKPQS